jgi:hypothetical protein
MVLLRIPSEHLGSIIARKSFYESAIDGRAAPDRNCVSIRLLMGTPVELGNFASKHADLEIRGHKGVLGYTPLGVRPLLP